MSTFSFVKFVEFDRLCLFKKDIHLICIIKFMGTALLIMSFFLNIYMISLMPHLSFIILAIFACLMPFYPC